MKCLPPNSCISWPHQSLEPCLLEVTVVREHLANLSSSMTQKGHRVGVAPYLVVSAAIKLQGLVKLSLCLGDDSSVSVLSKSDNQLCGGMAQGGPPFSESIQEFREHHFGCEQASLL
jgi:hypothetical protein